MTHDLLQSDIELATRLKEDQRPDEEVILALTHRGVDPGKAVQLLDDLRQGIRPTPQSPVPLDFAMGRRSRERSAAPGNEPTEPSRSSRAKSRNGSPAQSAGQGGKRTAAFWLTVAILVGIVITAGAVLLIQHYKASTKALEEQKPKAAIEAAPPTVDLA
jgi:hypothetical protein